MAMKCCCPSCGLAFTDNADRKSHEQIAFGWTQRLCASCVQLSPDERAMENAIRARLMEDRELSQAQQKYLRRKGRI